MKVQYLLLLLFCLLLSSCEVTRNEERSSASTNAIDVNTTPNADSANEAETDQKIGIKVGQYAPDISLPDTSGRLITLSSFRGKYVLLDFWASWCGPCRAENPNVVRMYEKYKDKNFVIVSVSLDKDRNAWLRAIATDGMNWVHMSDLMYWDSPVVALYKINGIPMTFLLDKEGKIVAKNIRGEQLEKKISSLISNSK
ncbi:MAG: TlpA family protein disulfide reductase [Cytophagaceae bacterium]|nr:TlpA family protein disulfide reductase [Cytophagaceae bacterium]MDW8455862.1 TlpA disulfide reductase family protein [Cytophagaceae bacterium]